MIAKVPICILLWPSAPRHAPPTDAPMGEGFSCVAGCIEWAWQVLGCGHSWFCLVNALGRQHRAKTVTLLPPIDSPILCRFSARGAWSSRD
jgi:hypothetical protein